jgi:hypothetical protein
MQMQMQQGAQVKMPLQQGATGNSSFQFVLIFTFSFSLKILFLTKDICFKNKNKKFKLFCSKFVRNYN